MTWLPIARRKAWLVLPVFIMVIFPLGPARERASGQRGSASSDTVLTDRTVHGGDAIVHKGSDGEQKQAAEGHDPRAKD